MFSGEDDERFSDVVSCHDVETLTCHVLPVPAVE